MSFYGSYSRQEEASSPEFLNSASAGYNGDDRTPHSRQGQVFSTLTSTYASASSNSSFCPPLTEPSSRAFPNAAPSHDRTFDAPSSDTAANSSTTPTQYEQTQPIRASNTSSDAGERKAALGFEAFGTSRATHARAGGGPRATHHNANNTTKYSSLKGLGGSDQELYYAINSCATGAEIIEKWSQQCYHHPALAAHCLRRAARYTVKRKGAGGITKKELKSMPLWRALCSQLATLSRFLDPTSLSMSAWALAVIGDKNKELLHALCVELLQKARLEEFDSYCLSIAAWAFGALEFRDDAIFGMICSQSRAKISTFNPQDISNLVWAMATLKFKDDGLFTIIAEECMRKVSQFNAQDLCNVPWAYATNGFHHDQLFEAIAHDCVAKMHMFGALNLVNAIWSFAHMQHYHEGLFLAAAKHAPSVLNAMDSQLLGNLIWSFTSFDIVDTEFFRYIITELAKKPAKFWQPPICAGEHLVKIMNPLHDFGVTENLDAFQSVERIFRQHFIDPMVNALQHVYVWPRSQYEQSLEVLQMYQLGEHYSVVALNLLGMLSLESSHSGKHEEQLRNFYTLEGGMSDRDPEKWGRATPSSHWLAASLHAEINGQILTTVIPAGPAVEDPERHIRGERQPEPIIEKNFISVALKSYGRAHHAEIQALEQIAQRFEGTDDLTTLRGRVELYGTHYPCVSCLGAMWQFCHKFPNIEFRTASFEWCAFAKSIRAIPPKERKIVKQEVPQQKAAPSSGCLIRYVMNADGTCGQSFYPEIKPPKTGCLI